MSARLRYIKKILSVLCSCRLFALDDGLTLPSHSHVLPTQVCDDRFDTGDNDFSPTSFDPRCRVWFQDAREKSRNGETVFTDPYVSLGTEPLTVTSASPVYAADGTTLLGVIGADTNFISIEASIKGLRVVGEEGYAYLLTATGGNVAVHPKLNAYDGIRNISDLEEGVDEDEFADVVGLMTRQCKGSANYQKGGDTWLISWEHERASGSGYGTVPDCPKAGFIVAVTVNEAALLRVSDVLCKAHGAVKLFCQEVVLHA